MNQTNSTILVHSQPRLFSGFLTAVVSGFLTYTFLQPLFFPVGLELAIVALNVLAINAAFVGMSLGVLLPLICPGLCFGVAASLLVGSLVTIENPLYFPAASAVVGVTGALVSARYVTVVFVLFGLSEKCPDLSFSRLSFLAVVSR